MEKSVSYLRISSKEQEEGYSLQSQQKESSNYARKKGLEIVKTWAVTESAGKKGRKDFNEMLVFMRKNRNIKHIVFEKVDRFTRNLYDLNSIYELMEKYDKQVHFFKESLIMDKNSKSQDKLRLDIQVVFARNYINNLSEEVIKGMKEKVENGEFAHFAPLGYVNNTETHLIEIDSSYAHFIKKMFELYATGNYSLTSLKEKMTEEGLRTRSGKKVHKSQIEKTLKNPIYYGYFRWKGQLYKGTHPHIIEKPLFDRVQQILNGRYGHILTKRSFAFTGLLRCAKCGCSITAEIKKNKYVYYHCTGFKGKCDNGWIREEDLVKEFGEIIKKIQINEEIKNWLVKALKQSELNKEEYHRRSLDALNKQYRKVQDRLDKAYTDKLDGIITEDFWVEKSSKWRQEQEDILNKIRHHQNADKGYMDLGVKILELAGKTYELWKVRKSQEKRQLLDFILSNCELDRKTLIPTYRKPFDILVKCKGLNWQAWRDSNPQPTVLETATLAN